MMRIDSRNVKDSTGAITWTYWLFLFPYSYGSRIISRFRRALSKEPTHTKVTDGWYIGGWPASDSELPETNCAVLDCITELPKKITSQHYLSIPVWDTFGFTTEQIQEGCRWAVEQSKEGRAVYVHCAYGHGRSCTMLSACLTEAGLFPNFVAAFREISRLRPRTYINDRQKDSLLRWTKLRGDTLPDDINTMPRHKPAEVTDLSLKASPAT